MTTRQEQFDIDRKKMMAQMGADEESIETENDIEMSDPNIGEVNPNWSDEQKEPSEAYKKDLLDDFNESMEVNRRSPEEFRKREAKIQQKKLWSEWVTKTILNFESIVMKIVTPFLILFGLVLWYQENLACGVVVFVASWFAIRVVLFAIALTIFPFIKQRRNS